MTSGADRSQPIGVNPREHQAEGPIATAVCVLMCEAEDHAQRAEDVRSEQPFSNPEGNESAAVWHEKRREYLEGLAAELKGQR